ncbi:hypothetical protein QOZ80_5BG0427340 [Eleusine coracana subsp. coracana]|nr:hypothetical protein QOZ80_5BG0427340 [Eleusine coracana subsp. coracana]
MAHMPGTCGGLHSLITTPLLAIRLAPGSRFPHPPPTMVQLPPPGPVEEAPAAQPFDPVLVRDFFHYLLVGVQGEIPETSRVTNFLQTAALGLHYWFESGMLVFIPAVKPIADAVPMLKFLKKKASSKADWEVLNIDHLELVANVATSLFKLGTELKKVRKMLKDLQAEEMMNNQAELKRDTLAVADLAEAAAVSEKILPAKSLHKEVKKVYRDLQILLKDTPVDLPDVNPFAI